MAVWSGCFTRVQQKAKRAMKEWRMESMSWVVRIRYHRFRLKANFRVCPQYLAISKLCSSRTGVSVSCARIIFTRSRCLRFFAPRLDFIWMCQCLSAWDASIFPRIRLYHWVNPDNFKYKSILIWWKERRSTVTYLRKFIVPRLWNVWTIFQNNLPADLYILYAIFVSLLCSHAPPSFRRRHHSNNFEWFFESK